MQQSGRHYMIIQAAPQEAQNVCHIQLIHHNVCILVSFYKILYKQPPLSVSVGCLKTDACRLPQSYLYTPFHTHTHIRDVSWLLLHPEVSKGFPSMLHSTLHLLLHQQYWLANHNFVYARHFTC